MNRKRIIMMTTIFVAVVGLVMGIKLLTAPGAPAGMPEHITIAQTTGEKEGQVVKVGGDVLPGSVRWDGISGLLSFTLNGEGLNMDVIYHGPAPNDFKPGLPMVVEGVYTTGGVFEASSITTRSSPLCKACHQ